MKCKANRLGVLLVEARKRAGLTQHEVAKELKYSSPQFVSNWERGLAKPPPKALAKLVSKFNYPASEIRDCLVSEFKREVDAIFKSR
jgi:transcriptional regulator with XRE-family HTH domain